MPKKVVTEKHLNSSEEVIEKKIWKWGKFKKPTQNLKYAHG